jgi:hypothetical protein
MSAASLSVLCSPARFSYFAEQTTVSFVRGEGVATDGKRDIHIFPRDRGDFQHNRANWKS